MPQDGETSLVMPVPAADPLLRGLARAFPGSVRDGVPAHISILHPFLPYLEVDDRVTEVLGSVFAAHGPVRVSFQTCERDADFVHLLPQPAGAVDDVIQAVRTAWPHILPYGGRFGDVPAHLTLTMGTSPATAEAARRWVSYRLPLEVDLSEAILAAFSGRWQAVRRFAFGTA